MKYILMNYCVLTFLPNIDNFYLCILYDMNKKHIIHYYIIQFQIVTTDKIKFIILDFEFFKAMCKCTLLFILSDKVYRLILIFTKTI